MSPPGQEAQVDFGYAGYFYDIRKRKKVKYGIFSMVLSYSRYRYYELVESMSIPTFVNCHINAFEYFGGAPKVIKIDNLKSGVLHVNFPSRCRAITLVYIINQPTSNHSPFTCITIAGISSALV